MWSGRLAALVFVPMFAACSGNGGTGSAGGGSGSGTGGTGTSSDAAQACVDGSVSAAQNFK